MISIERPGLRHLDLDLLVVKGTFAQAFLS